LFRRLLSYEEAQAILEQSISPGPVGVERVPLSDACGRILAEGLVALIDVPAFARSTVDGYAVKSEDTFGAEEDRPVSLGLCGHVGAGETPRVTVQRGKAAGISTGAPLPRGADAVVMLEYAAPRDGGVLVYRPVARGENVMKAGSDISKGETVLEAGLRLGPSEVGVLAALGLREVAVYRRPRVAIISTGGEIVEPGEPLPPGKVYDINSQSLGAAVVECGGEPVNLGIVPDDRDRLREALGRALSLADAVVTSGGVSVGPGDLIPGVLNELGKPGVIVSGVALRPGKPTTIGVIRGKPVFSLPGHPTSALMAFRLLVRPVLCRMAGRREEPPPTVRALASARMFPTRGRRTFVPVRLTLDGLGRVLASPVPAELSGAITTLARADGFIEIPESQQFVDPGDEVTVHLLRPFSH